MEQDSCKIGIVGAGPAGCVCGCFLKKLGYKNITFIDMNPPLLTILPTGGGRCNLAHSEYDFKELVKFYPRGEKFLYSVFSQFSTVDTIDFFNSLGLKTKTEPDGRIFPSSNSSKDVRTKILNYLNDYIFIKEKVLDIQKNEFSFDVITNANKHTFDKLIISTGGKSDFNILKNLGITIIEPKPSLVGLKTKEDFKQLSGVVVKNVYNYETGLSGDILFTHFGISGPLIYKISSVKARDTMPYELRFKLTDKLQDLQTTLNNNPHKQIKNVISDYLPLKFSEYIIKISGIQPDTKACNITGIMRDKIVKFSENFTTQIISTRKDGETVTAGGVNSDKINPKTMESKEIDNLYFCGEVIDVDGFCGGFNLQNCWSTAYIVANNI